MWRHKPFFPPKSLSSPWSVFRMFYKFNEERKEPKETFKNSIFKILIFKSFFYVYRCRVTSCSWDPETVRDTHHKRKRGYSSKSDRWAELEKCNLHRRQCVFMRENIPKFFCWWMLLFLVLVEYLILRYFTPRK